MADLLFGFSLVPSLFFALAGTFFRSVPGVFFFIHFSLPPFEPQVVASSFFAPASLVASVPNPSELSLSQSFLVVWLPWFLAFPKSPTFFVFSLSLLFGRLLFS